MIIAVIILSIALIICITLNYLLKKDIRLLSQSLNTIKKSDTNMRLTTTTFDKNVCTLCDTINDILDKQKKIILLSEKSNREFRQAITNISHDLRTPLTSAVGYIQMLKSDKTPFNKKEEYLNFVEYRLKSLSKLMNGLFEYTQIMEGKLEFNIEKVNICNIFRDIASSFYDDFVEKNFIVQINIPDTPVYAFCDGDSLRRVAQNLIHNVLAHGIELFKLDIDKENNIIIFQNKVLNIESTDVERLFDRFYTSDFSRSNGSSGLGLAIVKELIQNMGGEIRAFKKDEILEMNIHLPLIKLKH